MKSAFSGFYKPTDDEYKLLWDNSIFVFDANVLLNFYRYSESLRETLFIILNYISDRVWIPHQSAFEFENNKYDEIFNQETAYDNISSMLLKKQNEIIGELGKYSKHIFININEVIESLKDFITEVQSDLKGMKQNHPDLLAYDSIGNSLLHLFDGKIGRPFDEERLRSIYKSGQERYDNDIPPGFRDKNKKGKRFINRTFIEDRFGDLIVWEQIIEHAKDTLLPIILITDDTKEDWWLKKDGRILGPHPVLINEIFERANVKFYMYQTDQFIKFSNHYLKLKHEVQDIEDAIKEVQDVRALSNDNANDYDLLDEDINAFLDDSIFVDKQFSDSDTIQAKKLATYVKIEEKYEVDSDVFDFLAFDLNIMMNDEEILALKDPKKIYGKVKKVSKLLKPQFYKMLQDNYLIDKNGNTTEKTYKILQEIAYTNIKYKY